ncbi:hypothetical protein QEH68_14980 [Paenarthrobacter sp. OM7]|uniref:hypothetical protein n=1 Tax=Paenarthrobacter sp. OM7 TaxID=3041264 RepID=UPI0024692B21|nr:hypothetical protein [Paenarthrobacter sp. OM7]WGM19321.1 hypothetical protein QEH68_14980 [Paenarthrobacter sp. OM7]
MEVLLVLILLAVTAAVSSAIGRGRGRKDAAGTAAATGIAEHRAYQAGYLAGHMAGWRDAEAKIHAAEVSTPPQPAASAPITYGAGPAVTPASAPLHPPTHVAAPFPAQAPAHSVHPPTHVAAPFPAQAPAHSVHPPTHVAAPFPAQAPKPPSGVQPPAVPQRPVMATQPQWAAGQQVAIHRETPEAAAARKAKRDQQNINVTLYVASLLLVAAGALFVGTSLPALFRFAGICFITTLFYVAGLVIHAKMPRLRPAAVAFVGTGLALIPVTGLAMYNFVLPNGPAAWLVTSLLGTAVYAYTAVRLDNKVLAFLSLSFLVSTAWSGVSVLGGALVWYFTALIGVAIVLTLGALIRPRWLPPLYVRPLMVLHPYVVPLVALAVTVTPHLLAKGEYPLVMLMCGMYFAVMAFIPQARYRLQHAYGARATLTLALLGVVWDATSDVSAVMLAAVICCGVQSLGVALGGKGLKLRHWWYDALSCLGLQLATAAILTVVLALGAYDLPAYVPLSVTMVTAMVVGWKLGHGTEFAPGVVLAVSLPFMGLLGAWPVSALLASAALYWSVRAAAHPASFRQPLVLAARIAVTVAAPTAAAGVFAESPDRIALSLVALVAAAGVQQLVSAWLECAGVHLFVPQATLAGFGGLAVAGLLVLPSVDRAAGHQLVGTAVLLVLFAGAASGALMFPPTRQSKAGVGSWRPTLGEVLAPATAIVAGVVASATVSLALGNVVLLVAVAYFAATAMRMPVSSHRQSYWWLARAAGTVLAGSAYFDAIRHGFSYSVAGELPTVALVVVAAGALQLVLPLQQSSRRRFPRASVVDAGAVVTVMAGAATVLTVSMASGEQFLRGGWQPGVAAIATALAAILCGVVLRRHSAAWLFAPAALVLLLALRLGSVRDVEILLGLFAAYSGFMVAAAKGRLVRGGYMLGLRVLSLAFIGVLVGDLSGSITTVSMTLAVVLVLQHAVTWIQRSRGVDIAFQQAMVWGTLAAQLLLPAAYLLAGTYNGGGRWVVLIELGLCAASAVIAWRLLGIQGIQYFGIPAVVGGVIASGPSLTFPSGTWLYQPLLDRAQVPVVLLGLAAVLVVVRVVRATVRPGQGAAGHVAERWFWFIAAMAFVVTGGLLTLAVSYALAGLAVLVLASVLFAASHVEHLPALYLGAAPSMLVGAVPAVEGLLRDMAPGVWSDYAPWLVGGVGTAVLLYAVKRLGGAAISGEPLRRNALTGTAAVALASSAAIGLIRDETSWVGFFLVVATGALAVVEIPYGKWLAGEIAALASLAALQRAVLFVGDTGPDWFWTVQWYVLAGAVLAWLRYMRKQRSEGLLRLAVAAGALSLTSLGTIFGGTAPQQLYVLVGHAVLLVAGLLLAERAMVWWGAVGVALSVMWALRSYAFAMLALVALALIVLAVWRLNRKPQPPGGVPPQNFAPGGVPPQNFAPGGVPPQNFAPGDVPPQNSAPGAASTDGFNRGDASPDSAHPDGVYPGNASPGNAPWGQDRDGIR